MPLSLVEVLQAGSMPPRLAATFWLGMERGASLIVAAEPPSAGKTAILTALLSLTPPETVAYFTRGFGETFSLPPRADDHATYLLVNEISDHLPVYTWDSYARRTFELMMEGYSLATTLHAESVEEVVAVLHEELGVAQNHIANLTFIVPLHVSPGSVGARSARRRVAQVAFLRPDRRGGFDRRDIARWDADTDSFAVLESDDDRRAFAGWCDISTDMLASEIDRRAAFFGGLMANGTSSIRGVNAAIERFYAEEIRPRRSG